MKKNKTHNLILSIAILLCAVILLVTTSYAWFVSTNKQAGSVAVYTGDLNINATLLQGKDKNKNGELDFYVNENGEITNLESSREKINENLFIMLSEKEKTDQNNMSFGSIITYKAIIENAEIVDSNQETNAIVSLNLSNIEDYFSEILKERSFWDENNKLIEKSSLNEMLYNNTGRVMYALKNIEVRNYKKGEGDVENGLMTGYSVLTASSKISEVKEEVSFIPNVSEGSYKVFDLSKQELFIDNIFLPVGEVVEITFQLECCPISDIVEGYLEYYEKLKKPYESENVLTEAEKEQIYLEGAPYTYDDTMRIEKIIDHEIKLILSKSDTSQAHQLSFSIEKFYINAMQTNEKESSFREQPQME